MSAPRAKVETTHDGRVGRLTLVAPKANIVDLQMIGELEDGVSTLTESERLRAVVLSAIGPHFSFGASVEEHLPDRIEATLTALHRLLRRLLELPAPTLCAVRGQCLGGGLELALACDLIVAEESAALGCPEIRLGVFPPAAATLLPVRIGAGPAADLVLTGRSLSGAEAAECGLAARAVPEGELERFVESWLAEEFLPRSAVALRNAAAAARIPAATALERTLPKLERRYLDDLMRSPEAEEGIRAFLEKRRPSWAAPEAG